MTQPTRDAFDALQITVLSGTRATLQWPDGTRRRVTPATAQEIIAYHDAQPDPTRALLRARVSRDAGAFDAVAQAAARTLRLAALQEVPVPAILRLRIRRLHLDGDSALRRLAARGHASRRTLSRAYREAQSLLPFYPDSRVAEGAALRRVSAWLALRVGRPAVS